MNANDFLQLPPGVRIGFVVMLWPAIWAGSADDRRVGARSDATNEARPGRGRGGRQPAQEMKREPRTPFHAGT